MAPTRLGLPDRHDDFVRFVVEVLHDFDVVPGAVIGLKVAAGLVDDELLQLREIPRSGLLGGLPSEGEAEHRKPVGVLIRLAHRQCFVGVVVDPTERELARLLECEQAPDRLGSPVLTGLAGFRWRGRRRAGHARA